MTVSVTLIHLLIRLWTRWRFPGSASYWERRYAAGGNSGAGSYGHLAEFKGCILNQFVANHGIETVIEFGCGDGNQLGYFKFQDYLGIDVSDTAITMCRQKYGGDPTKRFDLLCDLNIQHADLAISLDVIYHLVEDEVFEGYMRRLFASSEKYVAIYSSDCDADAGAAHVRHRNIRDWVSRYRPEWTLMDVVRNHYPLIDDPMQGSFADFFFFRKLLDAET